MRRGVMTMSKTAARDAVAFMLDASLRPLFASTPNDALRPGPATKLPAAKPEVLMFASEPQWTVRPAKNA